MRKLLLSFVFMIPVCLFAQPQLDLDYYLPDGIKLDPAIPTPKSVIGFEVGEWHVSHDKLVNYMYALDKASDRITLEVTGHTYEGRPLLLLTITSPKNHQNIEQIRQQHLQLSDPSKSSSLDVKSMPADRGMIFLFPSQRVLSFWEPIHLDLEVTITVHWLVWMQEKPQAATRAHVPVLNRG